MQQRLEDIGFSSIDSKEVLTPGEENRNNQYKEILKDINTRQMEVYWEVFKHPDGISTKEVALNLRRSLHGISGRFTELSNPKGYDRRPYCNPPLIEPVINDDGSVKKKIMPNELGQMTSYLVFRACNGFNGGEF